MTTQTANEPIRLLSLGAGVQSSTMALMAAKGELPMPKAAIFADTQAEPESVYKWLDWLEKQLPYPVYRVTAGSLTDTQLRTRISQKTGNIYIKNMIPAYVAKGGGGSGLLARRCTGDFKVKPILRKAKEIAQIPKHTRNDKKGPRVEQWIGISIDEAHRMKPSQEWWAVNTWPLIDKGMTRKDCLNWMLKNGFPTPPRSACIYCPFHSDHEWKRLRNEEPEEWDKAVKFDYDLRAAVSQATGTAKLSGDVFLHASLVPLDKVDFQSLPEKNQLSLFGNECEGLCGV
jgi:hypothetical protein